MEENNKQEANLHENLKTEEINSKEAAETGDEKSMAKAEEKKEKKEKKGFFKNKKDEKICELEKQVAELKNDYLRARADFDNYRKRKEKEMAEARERAVVDFVLSILPSIDNFEMSLKMTDNVQMFVKGVEMIHKNLIDTLKEYKFEDFEPQVTENFDPYMHDPVLIEDNSKEPGKVIGVLKKGYKFKEKVIRPARVQVAKEMENEGPGSSDAGVENSEGGKSE